jgi:hypothetical protein
MSGRTVGMVQHKERDSMARKRVAHGHRENPRNGRVRWPLGNSGKIDTRISQHSTEQGISVSQQLQ